MIRIAFIFDRFELQSPAQQLLDRFLIGYNENGEFKRSDATVVAYSPEASGNSLLELRKKEFHLEFADSIAGALAQADCTVIAPGDRAFPGGGFGNLLQQAVSALRPGQAAYLDAALLVDPEEIARIQQRSAAETFRVFSSRAASHLVPLPVRPRFEGREVRKLLIVAQGAFPEPELDALHALKPYLGSRWTEAGTPRVARLENARLWDLAYSSAWRPLLAAAISRSDNIKGDPDRDGRTQDIAGLRLIEKLAPAARGWTLKQAHELEIAILILDGALDDWNFAAEAGGKVHSAQLYHPQRPMEDHYNDLAAWILERFRETSPAGKMNEALFISRIVERMRAERRSEGAI